MDRSPQYPAADNSRLKRLAARKSNYWIGFVSDPAMAIFFVFWDLGVRRANPALLTLAYFAGLLSWTLVEYVFHRWMYHHGQTLAHAGHKLHHESPKLLIGMPWWMTTGFLWLVYLFAYRLEFRFVLTFMAGIVTGFITYSALHHIHHHFNIRNTWYRKLYVHHQIHHKFSTVNFGVTNRFWDRVFGTTYRKQVSALKTVRKVRVPQTCLDFIWRLASAAQFRWR